jgi:hypothetical protein
MLAFVLSAALSLSVSPRIAFAPATVRARVSVDADATARRLLVVLVSGDFEQQSEIPIAPSERRQTVWLAPWVRVPTGDYTIVVAVLDTAGHITAREVTTVHIQPGLGQ